MTGSGSGPVVPPWCEHGPGGHDGGVPSAATAPAGARAWLLIESEGPWASEATATALPAPLAKLAIGADERGIRVQLIRRPDRGGAAVPAVFAGWTAGPAPWLRRTSTDDLNPDALTALAAGEPPGGTTQARPLFLVCTHARRDRCCGRFGVPLARDLATRYPHEVWETTHVGGHRFAANLVILPHGLYYGPVDGPAARAAIDAYQRG
ncbi:MAG: sucrase ferredoxin [Trebonia sp.]